MPNAGNPHDARVSPERDAAGAALVRFGDVLAAVQLRRDSYAVPEATPHVADVFNARGFFGDAAGVPTPDSPPLDAMAVRETVAASSRFSTTPAVADGTAPASADAVTERAPLSALVPDSPGSPPQSSIGGRAASVVARSTPIVAWAASAMPVSAATSSAARRFAASGAAPTAAPRAPRELIAPTDDSAAAPSVQVVVRAGEAAVEVIARVDRLGDQARATLRARIAAMLSRHGFSGGVVRLIGGSAVPRG